MESIQVKLEEVLPKSRNAIPALKPHVETSVRDISLRIYLHDSEDYDACCQAQLLGTNAWIHSITGSGFYMAMNEIIAKFKELGIKKLSGYARAPHVRLMQRMSEKAGVPFTIGDPEIIEDHALIWVTWDI